MLGDVSEPFGAAESQRAVREHRDAEGFVERAHIHHGGGCGELFLDGDEQVRASADRHVHRLTEQRERGVERGGLVIGER